LSFTTDCVDGQLARYTRTFSRLGAWLDSVFDRAKEYAVYAGLALGSTLGGANAWVLAAAALSLQTFRHTLEFSYSTRRSRAMDAVRQPPLEQPGPWAGRARAGAEEDLEAKPARAPRRRALRSALAVWRALERVPG